MDDDFDMEEALGLDLGSVDWGNFGKNVFGGVHTAGKVLASTFGGSAGASLADSAASLEEEGGLLPDWAKPAPKKPAKTVAVSTGTTAGTAKAATTAAAATGKANFHPVVQSLTTTVPAGMPTKTPRTSGRRTVEAVALVSAGLGLAGLLFYILRRR